MDLKAAKSVDGKEGKKRILFLVVCKNAESAITAFLEQMSKDIWTDELSAELLVLDDHSTDRTFYMAMDFAERHPSRQVTVLSNPVGQDYGGNQKIGFHYAINHGFYAVANMTLGGPDPSVYVRQMLVPFLENRIDAVFVSGRRRFKDIVKSPSQLIGWLGQSLLVPLCNLFLGRRFATIFGGHRIYHTAVLQTINFEHNSDDYDFDSDIIIQLSDTQRIVQEIVADGSGWQLPVFRELICLLKALRSCISSKIGKLGIYYNPKFDYEPPTNYRYKEKFGYDSSQQFAMDRVKEGSIVLDIGCGPGFMARRLKEKGAKTISVDLQICPETIENSWRCVEIDAEKYDFNDDFGKVDYILALDIMEHLRSPERLLQTLRQRFSRDEPEVIITTGNIGFFTLRLGLLFDSFNYGKRGILDMDHTRLFTFTTLTWLLETNGYKVIRKYGIPAPFPLVLRKGRLANVLLLVNRVLIFLCKSLFSYQIAVIAKPYPTLEHLLEDARTAGNRKA